MDEYKSVVGPVLLRLPGVLTVVNKSSSIDNTYRNFRCTADSLKSSVLVTYSLLVWSFWLGRTDLRWKSRRVGVCSNSTSQK